MPTRFGAIGPSHVDPRTRRDPRRRHRLREHASTQRRARCARSCWAVAAAAADAAPATPVRAASKGPASAPPRQRPPGCARHGDAGRRAAGLRARRARGARRSRPRQPEAAAVRARLRQGGRSCTRSGHTLGLRHNFRASRAYTEAQLSDPEFTRAHGTAGSVMEYNAVNLPRPGEAAACLPDRARPLRLLGHRVRLQADAAGSEPRPSAPSCSASPRAAASRCWPSAPTRTTPSASTPRRCSSTSAPTRSPSPPSGWRSRATCSGARRPALLARPRLRGAAPLAGLRASPTSRARRRRAGAPDRRRAHAARLSRQRPRPAAAGAGRGAARGAGPDRAQPCWRPTAWRSRRRCSAGWRPTSWSAANARRADRLLAAAAPARPAARACWAT